jgi:ABC transporter substrate binding protein
MALWRGMTPDHSQKGGGRSRMGRRARGLGEAAPARHAVTAAAGRPQKRPPRLLADISAAGLIPQQSAPAPTSNWPVPLHPQPGYAADQARMDDRCGSGSSSQGLGVRRRGRWRRGRSSLADMVRRRVAVIATPATTAASIAAKAATGTIPVVFGVNDDPVKLGLVASLARPGGNATGTNFFSQEVVAKRLALLHQLVPEAVRIAVLLNPRNSPNAETTLQEVQKAARTMGLQVHVLNAGTNREIDAVFATLTRERPECNLPPWRRATKRHPGRAQRRCRKAMPSSQEPRPSRFTRHRPGRPDASADCPCAAPVGSRAGSGSESGAHVGA